MVALEQLLQQILRGASETDSKSVFSGLISTLFQGVPGGMNADGVSPSVQGIADLVKRFQNAGLGALIQSWISTGPNQPVSAEQLQQILGIKDDAVLQQLAQILPGMIDHLTPSGQLPPDVQAAIDHNPL